MDSLLIWWEKSILVPYKMKSQEGTNFQEEREREEYNEGTVIIQFLNDTNF